MPNKKNAYDSLYRNVSVSEPLTTFKDSMESLMYLVATRRNRKEMTDLENSLKATKKSKKAISKAMENFIRQKRSVTKQKGKVERTYNEVKEMVSARTNTNEKNRLSELAETLAESENLMSVYEYLLYTAEQVLPQVKRTLVAQEKREERLKRLLALEDKKQQLLLPLALIYAVAVWDAFIIDTVKKIISCHPQLISESGERPDISKSFLWNVTNADQLKDMLIDCELRKLMTDQKTLITTFKQYWGIDLAKTTIPGIVNPLDHLREIRARRDVWVHNKGTVNQQYLNMAADTPHIKLGELAEVTEKYLLEALRVLIVFAKNIHIVAKAKHYSSVAS